MTEAELIELVKSHEILWAQTHPDYYNKHEREIVWREIQIKLGPNAGELLVRFSLVVLLTPFLIDSQCSAVQGSVLGPRLYFFHQ